MSFRLDDLSAEMIAQIENTYGPDGSVKPEHEFNQECDGCHARLPPDDDYFFFKEGVLQQPCKACRRKEQDDQAKGSLIKATKLAAAYLGPNAVSKIAKGELVEAPGVEDLAFSLGQIFCGTDGMATLAFKEFFAHKPNAVRVRIFEWMTQVLKASDSAKDARRGKDKQEVSEEDLQAALERFAHRIEGKRGYPKGQKPKDEETTEE